MKNSLFAIASATDARDQLSLKFLFDVVLDQSSIVVGGLPALLDLLDNGVTSELVVLEGVTETETLADVIKRIRKLNSRAVVVVLQPEPIAGFEAAAFRAGATDVISSVKSLKDFGYRLRTRMDGNRLWDNFAMDKARWDLLEFFVSRAHLTAAESQILHQLLTSDGEIVTRDDLSQAIDSRPWSYGNRKFDVHIANLRKKLRDRIGPRVTVRTIRSVGYQLIVKDSETLEVMGIR